MGDWIGTGTVASRYRKYRPFKEARTFARSLGLKNRDEWSQLYRSSQLPDDIPAAPNQTYKDQGWVGYGDWLGTGTVAPRYRKYRPFKEARKFARNLGLKNTDEWREFCRSGQLPVDIPTGPDQAYKNHGWTGMRDWLGKDS